MNFNLYKFFVCLFCFLEMEFLCVALAGFELRDPLASAWDQMCVPSPLDCIRFFFPSVLHDFWLHLERNSLMYIIFLRLI